MSLGLIILIAIGGTFAVEGFIWAVYDKTLHITGLVCVAIGMVLIGIAVKALGP